MLRKPVVNRDTWARLVPISALLLILNLWLSHILVSGDLNIRSLTPYTTLFSFLITIVVYGILFRPSQAIVRMSVKKDSELHVRKESFVIVSIFSSVTLLIGIYILTNHLHRMM